MTNAVLERKLERIYILNYLSNIKKNDEHIFDKIENLINELSDMESIGEISYQCYGPKMEIYILDITALSKFISIISSYEKSILN